MRGFLKLVRVGAACVFIAASAVTAQAQNQPRTALNTALVNGRWFNGHTFEERTLPGGRQRDEWWQRIDFAGELFSRVGLIVTDRETCPRHKELVECQ